MCLCAWGSNVDLPSFCHAFKLLTSVCLEARAFLSFHFKRPFFFYDWRFELWISSVVKRWGEFERIGGDIGWLHTMYSSSINHGGKGGFTLGSKAKETSKSSDLVGREQYLGPENFTLDYVSKVYVCVKWCWCDIPLPPKFGSLNSIQLDGNQGRWKITLIHMPH